jgi:hypothetical protein
MSATAIAVIGAGQLGSRHLQALMKLNFKTALYVVEPCEESVARTKSRLAECGENADISTIFCREVEELPKTLDLVIIATGSAVRSMLTKRLLVHAQVRYLVLEKFLFQTLDEYDEIGDLIRQRGVTTYVNCPRRMFDYYHQLRELLADEKILRFSVIGGNWGMGCNAIHFLDIFAYLAGCDDFELEDRLDPGYIDSKRPGYIEFTGAIGGRFACGSEIELVGDRRGGNPPEILIQSEKHNIWLRESGGVMQIADADSRWTYREEKITIQFQSGLSNLVAEELIHGGRCELTPFDTSAKYHKVMLTLCLKHLGYKLEDKKSCPIT